MQLNGFAEQSSYEEGQHSSDASLADHEGARFSRGNNRTISNRRICFCPAQVCVIFLFLLLAVAILSTIHGFTCHACTREQKIIFVVPGLIITIGIMSPIFFALIKHCLQQITAQRTAVSHTLILERQV